MSKPTLPLEPNTGSNTADPRAPAEGPSTSNTSNSYPVADMNLNDLLLAGFHWERNLRNRSTHANRSAHVDPSHLQGGRGPPDHHDLGASLRSIVEQAVGVVDTIILVGGSCNSNHAALVADRSRSAAALSNYGIAIPDHDAYGRGLDRLQHAGDDEDIDDDDQHGDADIQQLQEDGQRGLNDGDIVPRKQ